MSLEQCSDAVRDRLRGGAQLRAGVREGELELKALGHARLLKRGGGRLQVIVVLGDLGEQLAGGDGDASLAPGAQAHQAQHQSQHDPHHHDHP